MTSRTPVRLTPHRGPLATPSTSAESSPASSTPPTNIFSCPTGAFDIATLKCRISTLGTPAQQQYRSHLYRWRHEVTKQGLFGRSRHPPPLGLAFERFIHSVCDLAQSCAGIITFCLLIWVILEWSSYASGLPRQPNPSTLVARFPVPSPARARHCHMNPSSCELRDQHVAILHFLSEQIQHAKAMSSLSIGLGLPLRALIEAHRATNLRVIVRHNFTELPRLVHEVDVFVNLTELLDPPVLDFTSGGFIGRSLTLALDELGDLISEPTVSHGSPRHREHQDAHLHAIYWRTTSNLLLEYSAARPRARRLLQHLYTLHQQLASSYYTTRSIEAGPSTWWWNGVFRYPATSADDGSRALLAGLELTLDNIHRLIAYLDWTTDQLVQTTLEDVLKKRQGVDFSSCVMSLQELLARSKPLIPKKLCFCLNDYGAMSIRPKRAEIMVPGSRTMRAGR